MSKGGERVEGKVLVTQEKSGEGIPPTAQESPTSPPQHKGMQNLIPKPGWKPGQSGNPSGRPKSPLSHLREIFGKDAERDLLRALYGFALNRPELANRDKIPAREQAQALDQLINRIWGKPKENVEVTGGIGVVNITLSEDERKQMYRYVLEGRLDQLALDGGETQAIDAEFQVQALGSGDE